MDVVKILLVESDVKTARSVSTIIRNAGYDVVKTAITGSSALKNAIDLQPDLVLIDIVIKGAIDSIETAVNIHQNLDIPIVFLIGENDKMHLKGLGKIDHDGWIFIPQIEIELQCSIELALSRHKTEQRMKQGQALLSTTLKSIGDAVITTDSQSLITFLNPVAEKLTGWPLNEAIGKPILDVFNIINEETQLPAKNPVTRILEKGVIVELANHTVLISRNGRKIPIDDSGAPIKDDLGNISGAVLVFRDVTEQKKAQKALEFEKTLIDAMLNTFPEYIYFKDLKSRFYRISKSLATEVFGLSDPKKAIGKSDFDFFPAKFAQEEYDNEQNIIKTGRSVVDDEVKRNWINGSVSWAASTKMPLINEKGQIIGTFGISKNITKQKRVEEALAKEHNLLKTVIDNVPDKIYAKDTEGRFIICNKAVAVRMGKSSPEEVIGQTDFDFMAPELATQFHQNEQAIIKSGKPLINHEEPLDQSSGGVHWNSATKVPLRDARGEIIGIVGLGRDITTQKQMEETLRKSEEKYRRLFEEAIDAIFVADAETGILVDCNRSALDLVGRERSEIIGQHQRILHPKEQIKGDRSETFQKHLTQKEGQILETQVITKSGEIREVDIKASIFELEDKKVLLGVFRDVTDQKRAEMELAFERNLLHILLNNIPDHIYFKDQNSHFLRISKALAKWFGMDDPKQAIGKSDFDFFSKEHAQAAYANEQEIMKSGHPVIDLEEKETWPDRHETWVSTTKMPIRDEKGQIVGTFGISRDITERKRMEEAILYEKSLLDALMENLPDHIYFKDRDSRFLKMSNSQAERFGLDDPQKAVGKTDFDFFTEEHARPAFEDEQRIIQSGQPIIGLEEKETWPDGKNTWVSTTKLPLKDVHGQIIGTFGVSRNINDRKLAEEQREKVIQELQEAINKINTLRGLIPICANCKKIRDDKGYWNNVESYIQTHAEVEFTHGICPDCMQKLYPDYFKKKEAREKKETDEKNKSRE